MRTRSARLDWAATAVTRYHANYEPISELPTIQPEPEVVALKAGGRMDSGMFSSY